MSDKVRFGKVDIGLAKTIEILPEPIQINNSEKDYSPRLAEAKDITISMIGAGDSLDELMMIIPTPDYDVNLGLGSGVTVKACGTTLNPYENGFIELTFERFVIGSIKKTKGKQPRFIRVWKKWGGK